MSEASFATEQAKCILRKPNQANYATNANKAKLNKLSKAKSPQIG